MPTLEDITNSLADLGEDVKHISETLASQTVEAKYLKEEVTKLRQVLVEGNGRVSLMERTALVEIEVDVLAKSASEKNRGEARARTALITSMIALIGTLVAAGLSLIR